MEAEYSCLFSLFSSLKSEHVDKNAKQGLLETSLYRVLIHVRFQKRTKGEFKQRTTFRASGQASHACQGVGWNFTKTSAKQELFTNKGCTKYSYGMSQRSGAVSNLTSLIQIINVLNLSSPKDQDNLYCWENYSIRVGKSNLKTKVGWIYETNMNIKQTCIRGFLEACEDMTRNGFVWRIRKNC